jgi:hypothetical protein
LIHDFTKRIVRFGLVTTIHLAGHMRHGTSFGILSHFLLAKATGGQGDQHPDGERDAVDEE